MFKGVKDTAAISTDFDTHPCNHYGAGAVKGTGDTAMAAAGAQDGGGQRTVETIRGGSGSLRCSVEAIGVEGTGEKPCGLMVLFWLVMPCWVLSIWNITSDFIACCIPSHPLCLSLLSLPHSLGFSHTGLLATPPRHAPDSGTLHRLFPLLGTLFPRELHGSSFLISFRSFLKSHLLGETFPNCPI